MEETTMKRKQAFFFSLDAFLAGALFIGAILLVITISNLQPTSNQLDFAATDAVTVLANQKITDVNDPYIDELIARGLINDTTKSVLYQIGELWAINNVEEAKNLTAITLNKTIPERYGFNLTIGGDIIFSRNKPQNKDILVTKRMISGIKQGEALRGTSAAAFLKRIRGRDLATFVYFGGFVGQGNISARFTLPSDLTTEKIRSFEMELDAKSRFTLSINGNVCGTFTPIETTDNYTPDYWDIAACNTSLQPGENELSFTFDDVNEAYIAGGYVKVTYTSETFLETTKLGEKQKKLPGITGIVNLYDAFNVPGNLTNLDVHLHYFANHTTENNATFYMTIGNKTILKDDVSTTEQKITIDDSLLSSVLNYTQLSRTTVPLRIGFENLTYQTSYKGNARVSLVTDVSGSMSWRMDSNSPGVERDCSDENINDSDSQRLSVAKCVDKEFIDEILNYPGNLLGLTSYDTIVKSQEPLTDNKTELKQEVDSYSPGDSTCICCGVNGAKDVLTQGLKRTVLIGKQSNNWLYETNNFQGPPPNDGSGNPWYAKEYDDSSWQTGQAPLGHGTQAATDMGSKAALGALYPNLWPHVTDGPSPAVDFDGGQYNSTGDTWGLGNGDDGWDRGPNQNPGPYEYDGRHSNIIYDWVQDLEGDNMLHFQLGGGTSGSSRNTCQGFDCSAAYGIEVNITQEQFERLSTPTGKAIISFQYEWRPGTSGFENSDQLWLKARWTSPSSGSNYLGSELSNEGADVSLEVDTLNNPDSFFSSNTYSQDISSLIEGPGMYYLDIGAKLLSTCSFSLFGFCFDSQTQEWGDIYIDDVELMITNASGSDFYYLRHHFTISSLDDVKRAHLNLNVDDVANVYLNGQLLEQNPFSGNGTYWDISAQKVGPDAWELNDNVLAIELQNSKDDALIDAELIAINTSKDLAALVMTDGQANICCRFSGELNKHYPPCSSTIAREDAVNATCSLRQDWGATVHTVGFSSEADETLLQEMASCGNGQFFKSDNASELAEFYSSVASTILEASLKSQTVVISGEFQPSTLFNDSYINITYTPLEEQPQPGELEVVFQSSDLNSCTPSVTVYDGVRVIDAVITSYSGEHWTDYLAVTDPWGGEAYNLSIYNDSYERLGDPYLVQIATDLIRPGANTLFIQTGDSPTNHTSCSKNNTFIYRGYVNASTERSDVVTTAQGCTWNIAFEDGSNVTTSIPESYTGSKTCSYNTSGHPGGDYNPQDAYDLATAQILDQLDFDDDGEVLVNLAAEDLEIIVTVVNQVPYLWGPTMLEVHVWD
ncbi:hypothetical protein D6783_01940 [Candidatus Woesearchaeota archaeon]|nr:MAG: hypothetical protein D6783_01940 [Candidatus Woesearchaeota archaeon]